MPENSNFPYRRYDRLPPIQQFSIESDTDLSETAELIEEYDVFDPARPRPKIILVIGMKTELFWQDFVFVTFSYLYCKYTECLHVFKYNISICRSTIRMCQKVKLLALRV